MRNNLGNIDKQPDGSYVAYALDKVWSVRKFVDNGTANFRPEIAKGYEAYCGNHSVRGASLRDLSCKLAQLDISAARD